MNTDIIKGQWHLIKETIKEQGGKLTDNEITRIKNISE